MTDTIFRVEYDRIGGPEVLIWRQVTLPPPAPGEVRIRMTAASVNPIDGKIRAGLLPPLPLALPAQTGRDGAGRVTALGDGVDPGWLSARVAFLAPRGGAGTWASAVNMPAAGLARIPDALPDTTAAALPLAGLSALALLAAAPPIRPGQRVLVHAAAGGVGRIALQLAHAAGAEVHATASTRNQGLLLAMGATRVWTHDTEDFSALRDVDLVLDLIGGAVHDRSYACLRPGGTMACLTAAPFTDRSLEHGVKVTIAQVAPDAAGLTRLLQLAAAGDLDATPGQILPMQDFAAAQRLSDSGRLSGKLVLDVGG